LARELKPKNILLAGLEEGVYANFPARTEIVSKITPVSYAGIKKRVGAGLGEDVTGGMESKVEQMIELVQIMPGTVVQIFSGEKSGQITKAIEGETIGTLVSVM
jgi:isopentenyl phosphate kinase